MEAVAGQLWVMELVPSETASSVKLTVPVGSTEPQLAKVTVAVTVGVLPKAGAVVEGVTTTELETFDTVRVSEAEEAA
jgi:hypothetical protein